MDVKEAIKQLGELRDGTQRAIDGHGMVYANGERIVLAKYSQALGTAINALAGHTPDPGADVSPALADEARAERLWDDDRRLFVAQPGLAAEPDLVRCGVL